MCSSDLPLWRTGGRAFAARPRSFEQKVNRKMYQGAVRSIFSELIRQGRLTVVENLEVEAIKTKVLASQLGVYGEGSLLLVGEQLSDALYLSARNLHWVGMAEVDALDPALLISFDKVLVTQGAMNQIEERLQ